MAFPQDVNYIINRLRDTYLRDNDNDMTRRIMKPYFGSTNTTFKGININDINDIPMFKDTNEFVDNLINRTESPPIQTNFYENYNNKKLTSDFYDNIENNNHDNVDEEDDEEEDEGPQGLPNRNKLKDFSLPSGPLNLRRSSEDSSRVPSLGHKISNIKEEAEDDYDLNKLSPTSTLSGSTKSSNINNNNNNNRFQNLRKNTYRSSFGKFFTKSNNNQKKDGDDDSDSSDDDEEDDIVINPEAPGSLMSTNSNNNNLFTLKEQPMGELVVEDKDEENQEDEDLLHIDHDEQPQNGFDYDDDDGFNSSFDSISRDESLIDGSFTDNDDDSMMDVAFERAASQWKTTKRLDENFMTISDNSKFITSSKLNESAFETFESDGEPSGILITPPNDIKKNSLTVKKTHKQQRSNSEIQENNPYKLSKLNNKSVPNNKTANHNKEFPIENKLVFTKKEIIVSTAPIISKLSTKLNANKKSSNPLEKYNIISGENLNNRVSVTVNVYMPNYAKFSNKPFEIKVKKTATVIELIGFILLKFNEMEKLETKDEKYLNVNKWKLQLSDEGEIFDEGFGVLDRTKKIEIYQPDEVSIIEVNEQEFEKNNALTPLSDELNDGNSNSNNYQHNIIINNDDGSFSNTLTFKQSPLIQQSTFDPKKLNGVGNNISLRIFLYPETSKYDILKFDSSDPISKIIKDYCLSKNLNNELYCIGLLNQDYLLNEKSTIESLGNNLDVQILSKQVAKTLNRQVNNNNNLFGFTDPSLIKSSTGFGNIFQQKLGNSPGRKTSGLLSSSLTRSKHKKNNTNPATPINLINDNNSKLKRFTVWRRQQVNFISRHEKIFTIDGDYIYILPSENGTTYHQSKTSSFHISQMIRVKQSRKYPINFKIIIKRKNSSEIKRYDFEAPSFEISKEIVQNLIFLKENWKINHTKY